MIHKGTKNIKTARLLLRKLELKDAVSLFELKTLGSTQEESNDIMRNMIADYDNDTYYHWEIEYGGLVVGRVKVNEISERDNFMQLAYDIGSDYRNKGLMTEAVKGIIYFLFNDVGVHRIYELIRVNNIASNRVAQKAGMMLEGCLRNHYIENDGSYTDVNVYGINKEDLN